MNIKNFFSQTPYFYLWVAVYAAVFIWSAIHPKDYITWLLEVLPAIIGIVVLAFTYDRFRLTPLLYFLILVHMIILMVGGHYTYAEVPLFDWIRDYFGQSRNNFDKVGHFAQGFVPAIIAREILIRKNVVNGRAWMNFIIVAICLAISAFYELIEWQVDCGAVKLPKLFSVFRDMSGIPSRIWHGLLSVRSPPCSC